VPILIGNGGMKHLKSTLLVIAALFTFSAVSEAAVSRYKIEKAPMISGGLLKISEAKRGNGFRQLKFKYKLETAAGFKEDWLPYNFPEQVFSANFLNAMAVGQSVALGSLPHGWERKNVTFSIKRESRDAYMINSSDGNFRIYPQSGSSWRRVEIFIKGLRLFGNRFAITRN